VAFQVNFDSAPDGAFVRARVLCGGVIPFSESTLWRKAAEGTFPEPVKLSARVTAWRVGDVRKWLQACMAAGGGQ
jgi:prophage regulatory protein